MKKETIRLNAIFAVVLGAALLTGMVWRALVPNVVLMKLDLPAIVALSLLSLLIEYFLAGAQKRDWLTVAELAILTWIPLCQAAGYGSDRILWKLFGTVTFLVVTWLFDLAVSRLEATVECKGAVIPAAILLYLASQGFAGFLS